MQTFGEALSKAVGQRFEHDARIIIEKINKLFFLLLNTHTACYGEKTYVIFNPRWFASNYFGRDKVS